LQNKARSDDDHDFLINHPDVVLNDVSSARAAKAQSTHESRSRRAGARHLVRGT
jgi:hypothetical protein